MLWDRASWLPPRLIAPTVGLKPKQPQKLEGRTIEPNTWVPIPTLIAPTATAAAEPLLEPPGVRVRSHGFLVARGCIQANSVVTVLPTITAPASRSAATLAAVALAAAAGEQRRTVLGGHVDGFDDVLDSDRHAVDRRERLAGAPAVRGAIRRRPRAGEIERDEGADLRLPGVELAMQRSRNARGESFPLAKSAVAGRNGCIRGFVASGAFMGSLLLLCIASALAASAVLSRLPSGV